MSYFTFVAVISVLMAKIFADPGVIQRPLLYNPTAIEVEQIPPQPYEFGYEIADGLGSRQHRREFADGTGTVRGSYGFVDPLGVRRIVEYTADIDGYRAIIHSNEPGLGKQDPANAAYILSPPPAVAVAQGLQAVLLKPAFRH